MSDSREPFSAEKMFVSPELAELHRKEGERVLDWVKRVNTYIPITPEASTPITPEASAPITTPPYQQKCVRSNIIYGGKRVWCDVEDRDVLESRAARLGFQLKAEDSSPLTTPPKLEASTPITPEASATLTTPPKLVRSERICSNWNLKEELESVKTNLFTRSKKSCFNPDSRDRRLALIAASERIKDLKSKILIEAADIYRPKFKKHGCEDLFQELMDDINYWLM